MTLNSLLWIVAIVAIHTFGLLIGYMIANKRNEEFVHYTRMAIELVNERAKEIKEVQDRIGLLLSGINEHVEQGINRKGGHLMPPRAPSPRKLIK